MLPASLALPFFGLGQHVFAFPKSKPAIPANCDMMALWWATRMLVSKTSWNESSFGYNTLKWKTPRVRVKYVGLCPPIHNTHLWWKLLSLFRNRASGEHPLMSPAVMCVMIPGTSGDVEALNCGVSHTMPMALQYEVMIMATNSWVLPHILNRWHLGPYFPLKLSLKNPWRCFSKYNKINISQICINTVWVQLLDIILKDLRTLPAKWEVRTPVDIPGTWIETTRGQVWAQLLLLRSQGILSLELLIENSKCSELSMSFWEIGLWCRRGQPAPATFLYQDWWKYMKPMCPRPTNTSSLSPRCPDDTAPRCPKTLVSPRYTRQKDEEKAKHFGSASWKSMTLNIKPLSHPKSFSIQQNSTPSPEPWQQNQSNFNKWKRQITIKQQSVVLWSFWSKVLDWPIVHKVFSFSRVLCLAIQQHLEFQDFSNISQKLGAIWATIFPTKTEPKLLASRRPCSNSSIAARWAPALWPISITCR